MREYSDDKCTGLTAVFCNKCRKQLKVENGIVKEGCFYGDILFGYFSKKDGMRHFFDLCEECYDGMTKDFKIPVCEIEESELC